MTSSSRSVVPAVVGLSLVGVAALAVPVVLALQNPSGITVEDGVLTHSGEVEGAVLRASDIAPGASLHAESTSVEGGVVQLGLGPVCLRSGLDAGASVTLTGVRPLVHEGTPVPEVRGVLRRLASFEELDARMGTATGRGPGAWADDDGTPSPGSWSGVEREKITALCTLASDGSEDTSEAIDEVGVEVDVDGRGLALGAVAIDYTFEGAQYALVVDVDARLSGTEVTAQD